MTVRRQQWRWSEQRLTERLPSVRVTPADRLRVLEEAERQGIGEGEVIRRLIFAALNGAKEPHT